MELAPATHMKDSQLQAEFMESLFRSQDPRDLIRFYSSFKTLSDFKSFFLNRVKAEVSIVEYESDKNIPAVVVVPTSDVHGPLARSFRQAFSGIDLIFVQSSGHLFNFSHSMNVGIRRALTKMKPWVILSNDDVKPRQPILKVINDIARIHDVEWFRPIILTNGKRVPSSWTLCQLPQRGLLSWLWDARSQGGKDISSTYHLVKTMCERFSVNPLVAVQCDPIQSFTDRIVASHRVKGLKPFLNVQPFAIFKSTLLKSFSFDESYVNACEDMDLSLRLYTAGQQGREVKYFIETTGGASFGTSRSRWLRYGLSGRVLFADNARQCVDNFLQTR